MLLNLMVTKEYKKLSDYYVRKCSSIMFKIFAPQLYLNMTCSVCIIGTTSSVTQLRCLISRFLDSRISEFSLTPCYCTVVMRSISLKAEIKCTLMLRFYFELNVYCNSKGKYCTCQLYLIVKYPWNMTFITYCVDDCGIKYVNIGARIHFWPISAALCVGTSFMSILVQGYISDLYLLRDASKLVSPLC